jgi:hypothetical protein
MDMPTHSTTHGGDILTTHGTTGTGQYVTTQYTGVQAITQDFIPITLVTIHTTLATTHITLRDHHIHIILASTQDTAPEVAQTTT